MPGIEKRRPHYAMAHALDLIGENKVRATKSAYEGASEIGMHTLDEMCDVVKRLTIKDFYKSMTTHGDHTIWQDVYRPTLPGGIRAYVKLTIQADLLIISFKEL